ncbi:MAG TPA: hypothetical protein VMU84_17970, partial [Thermoanaerobaculia bacterium]|nr:hypothetical protein [Thermoanaerobaculia bacterium]
MMLVVWLTAALVIAVPGYAIARAVDRRVYISSVVAYGLAFWPIVFLWKWTAVAMCAIYVGQTHVGRASAHPVRLKPALPLLAILAIVVATRIVHINGLALPLWIDSVHHTMIVRDLLEHGTIPSSYHWGFHVVPALVAKLTSMTSPIEIARVLLGYGQLLNALVFFAIYDAARLLLRSRRAGLLAAVLATLVSYFPAYYVSWGRYPQLAGLLLLGPLAIALFRGRVLSIAILAAGLALIHVRIAILAATLAIAMPKRKIKSWLVALGIAAIAISPWLWTIAHHAHTSETPNTVFADLLWAPHNILLMIVAAGGAIVGWKRHRRAIAMLAIWTALSILTANPNHSVMSNAALLITMFIPLSFLGAMWHRPSCLWLTIAIAIIGAWTMRDIVNPNTVIARKADVRAMQWIATHTQRDAKFAITVRPWLGNTFAGVDGGYWIEALTDRRTILPRGFYSWTRDPFLERWSASEQMTPALREELA